LIHFYKSLATNSKITRNRNFENSLLLKCYIIQNKKVK